MDKHPFKVYFKKSFKGIISTKLVVLATLPAFVFHMTFTKYISLLT
jgi:hypothetical protein